MKKRSLCILYVALILAGCGGAGGNAGSQAAEIQNSKFTSPLNGATAASIAVDVPFEKAFVSPLSDSGNLIEAEVEHIGDMKFGEEKGTLTLSEDTGTKSYTGNKPLRWNVLVSPNVPLALDLSTASGELTLDASNLTLSSLVLNSSSGTIEADLPASAAAIAAKVEVASGGITANLPDNATVDFSQVTTGSGTVVVNILGAAANVDLAGTTIGSGRVKVDVPDGAAVHLEVQNVASGTINIAFRMTRLTGTASNEGIWETDNYENADRRITIVVTSIASGTFELE